MADDQPIVGRASRFKHLDRPASRLEAGGDSTIDVVEEDEPAAGESADRAEATSPPTPAKPVEPAAQGKKKQKQKKNKGDASNAAGSPLKRTISEADIVAESPALTPAKKKKKKKNGNSAASSLGEYLVRLRLYCHR